MLPKDSLNMAPKKRILFNIYRSTLYPDVHFRIFLLCNKVERLTVFGEKGYETIITESKQCEPNLIHFCVLINLKLYDTLMLAEFFLLYSL